MSNSAAQPYDRTIPVEDSAPSPDDGNSFEAAIPIECPGAVVTSVTTDEYDNLESKSRSRSLNLDAASPSVSAASTASRLSTPTTTKAISPSPSDVSPWVVLRHPLFRALAIASLVSNLGTQMHEIAGSWLMTTLRPSPLMVSLMSTAASLPMFLLALPAGALSDVLDRRKLLIYTELWLCLCAGALGILTWFNLIGPIGLLVATFLLSIGSALSWPAWQAVQPELVPKHEVPAAITLGGVNWNLSRIIGPFVGGLIVEKAGPAAVFALNSFSFVAVMAVLVAWRRTPTKPQLPETVLSAIRAGVRYARHSPGLRAALFRCFFIMFFGSGFWALRTLLARQDLNLSPRELGWLMAWFGLGAVIGGILLSRIRSWAKPGTIVTMASAGLALHELMLGGFHSLTAIYAAMVFGGVCWTACMITLNIAVLHLSPEWVRSRSAAIYLLTFMAGLSGGSFIWGVVAEHIGIRSTLAVSGIGLLLTLPVLHLLRIPRGEAFDLSPSKRQPVHTGADADPNHHEGPVLIVLEYFVAPEKADEFADAIGDIRRIRLRDGASRWELFRDTDNPERHLESFLVESWAEHLRQHERLTVSDRAAETRAYALTRGGSAPRVQHFVTRA